MGLSSALTTALTGLTAAETQIDVVGNNLANSQTVGFKASETVFATQFLQTLGLGSAPTATSGGVNPRQTGLGTQVAEITPNFGQGTIEISTNASDLAIQGDGFFVVEGQSGEQLYTRNGIFKTNADNELVTVTGNRLLGFGVNDAFELQTTQLVPLNVPLGAAAVAQATENVFLQGTLTPTGDVANTAEVIESAILSDGSIARPDSSAVISSAAPTPDVTGVGSSSSATGGSLTGGATYQYKIVFLDNSGSESSASSSVSVTLGGGDDTATLTTLPNNAGYSQVNVYRTAANGSNFFLLNSAAAGAASFVDDGSTALSATPLDNTNISGNYSYLITYSGTGLTETRPSQTIGPVSVSNDRIHLTNLPTLPAGYDMINVYRNLASDASSYYLVSTLSAGETYTDNRTDLEISDLTVPANKLIDLDGPKVNASTLLVDVLRREDLDFEQVFSEGTLGFTGRKGGRSLGEKTFTISATSTVQEFIDFTQDALGIQVAADDPQNPVPGSENNIPSESGILATGASVSGGKIRIVGNNGVDNSIGISLSAFQLTELDGDLATPSLGFGSIQTALGQSAVTDFVAYDTLGIPLNVRVTAVLESRTGSASTYRWFADSSDNDPISGSDISVGTGQVVFDGEGNVVTVTNPTISIERRNTPSTHPLEFDLDFSVVSGLAAETSSLATTRQDGSPAGTLTSFLIGEDGVIRGVFNNGSTRDLGAIQLVRFTNPPGLEQRGQNQFASGANSGLPLQGDPGVDGLGSIIAGAVELSNTDIGNNLIDLVLASTQYRANTRVITAAQQLLDELLNLRR